MKNLTACLVACIVLTGCIAPRSYVDPVIPRVTYEEIQRLPNPIPLVLEVEFQRNGEHMEAVDPTLRDAAERVLRASSVISPVSGIGEGKIRVVVNNVTDLGTAFAKGFGTGLTFGLVGSDAIDNYETSITITMGNRIIKRSGIRHRIITAIGNTSIPPGVETTGVDAAFGRALEQMVLFALKDIQRAKELDRPSDPATPESAAKAL